MIADLLWVTTCSLFLYTACYDGTSGFKFMKGYDFISVPIIPKIPASVDNLKTVYHRISNVTHLAIPYRHVLRNNHPYYFPCSPQRPIKVDISLCSTNNIQILVLIDWSTTKPSHVRSTSDRSSWFEDWNVVSETTFRTIFEKGLQVFS